MGGKIFQKNLQYISVKLPSGKVLHIRTFTQEIVEIIACSKLLITKTGSCSVNEAIYLRVPLLLDDTKGSSARHLWWERFNLGFIRKIGRGEVFSHPKQLTALIPQFLKQRASLSSFAPPDFSHHILRLVDQMVQLEPETDSLLR
jgi:UDP-N-acetylglucosamine:LPS N-acetylglucosamine transferase